MIASEAQFDGRGTFHQLLRTLRPKLHRYCARMTGSAFDGEDVLQEALSKAIQAFPDGEPPGNVEAWLFRIAHNTAIDFLRRRRRQGEFFSNEVADMVADESPTPEDRSQVTANLGAFMLLPPAQRSSIILMDVLGYSMREVADILHLTLPALKATLHRGRDRVRAVAGALENALTRSLGPAERALLSRYVDRFNARDFDAIRDMLADEVRLDMVNKAPLAGAAEVAAKYLHNYGSLTDWRFSLGMVDGKPGLLARDSADPVGPILYFVQITWSEGRVVAIRDFRYARYVTEGAEIRNLD
jgi:RNA polymerase sigma-70 factor (ECF subfamily)